MGVDGSTELQAPRARQCSSARPSDTEDTAAAAAAALTLMEPRSRFGDKPLKLQAG